MMKDKKKLNLTQKLIKDHLIEGEMIPGKEIALKIDHVLQQDATGTLVMLELEAVGLEHVEAELAVQYVDHNLLQTDYRNADDHRFLYSAARKLGYHYSKAGNGISHVVHMEKFGVPGKTLLGSDSHTCGGGGLGMLAIGTGGLDVALAAAGKPYYVKMPKVLGVELTGQLPKWVSAKDVVLEMLRRYDVKGAKGYIIEYFGDGVEELSTWDRHVIANMGTEMGATSSVFPSDENTRQFLMQQKRVSDWKPMHADKGAGYDKIEKIDLSTLESLIACPSSPGNVVPVREVAGESVSQVVVGSSANPGYRDFWIVSQILKGRKTADEVSLDINPSSNQVIQMLSDSGALGDLVAAGGRFHQTGCMGCIGMGQSPASGENSLRTMPRNFPGRSGTEDDKVFLCSPETAAASALTGEITVPSDLEEKFHISFPPFVEPEYTRTESTLIVPPATDQDSKEPVKLGPNIKPLPHLDQMTDDLKAKVILKMGDNISTDEILKAGAEVLPLRSNIPEISKYAYYPITKTFYKKSKSEPGGHIVVAGENYAQGSSREHAALAPRYLGQKAVLAKSYARIGWQNLINFGIVPFEFSNPDDYDHIDEDDVLIFKNLRDTIKSGDMAYAFNETNGKKIPLTLSLSERQIDVLLAGGVINYLKQHN